MKRLKKKQDQLSELDVIFLVCERDNPAKRQANRREELLQMGMGVCEAGRGAEVQVVCILEERHTLDETQFLNTVHSKPHLFELFVKPFALSKPRVNRVSTCTTLIAVTHSLFHPNLVYVARLNSHDCVP